MEEASEMFKEKFLTPEVKPMHEREPFSFFKRSYSVDLLNKS